MLKNKSKQKEKGLRFTGGDHLVGFDKILHDLMMRNELADGYQGYEVCFAKKGKSGLSFGGNQMDMSKNSKYAKLFVEILENATTIKGDKIFKKSELLAIVGDKNIYIRKAGLTPEQVFGANLDRVNRALASEYGIKAINAAYLVAIKQMKEKVNDAINGMKNLFAKTFYSSDFGRALLCDYENQYGLKVNGVFVEKYINGYYNNKRKIDYETKKTIYAPIDTYSQKEHEIYLRSTQQWAENHALVDDRLVNTLNLLLDKYGLYHEGPLDLSKVGTREVLKCSAGYHAVKACIVHYPPSKAHPKGLTTLRRAHCAKNPIKK